VTSCIVDGGFLADEEDRIGDLWSPIALKEDRVADAP
jgi:hypothetical protein